MVAVWLRNSRCTTRSYQISYRYELFCISLLFRNRRKPRRHSGPVSGEMENKLFRNIVSCLNCKEDPM